MDPRVRKLANLLINYSLQLKKGQLFKIKGEYVAMPLMQAAFEEALAIGANPYIEVICPEATEAMLKRGSKDQITYVTPMARLEITKMDSLLVIWANQNTNYLAGADPKKQALMRKGRSKLQRTLFKRIADKSLTWVGTAFPTQADAQKAEMSLRDYEEFVYRAGNLHLADPVKHWKQVAKEQGRLVKILNRVDRLHIRGSNADLKLRVKGRKWISCHGTQNFPDGEIFTSPLENTPEGYIHFTYPAEYDGRSAENVRLEFKAGRVVAESASRNQAFVTAMLNTDKGSRLVGEIAVGTNYEIKQATGNTLFDEKIGGTCHLAVGASILESGGKNHSAVHWDMVCDLKKDGEIVADGKVIYRKGKFII
ncbi:MAG: aminopeptidase [candidate division Zixibacteria bacterium]|nr:aminopeptidase [candidate division Zixibacteria bacterium]